MTWRTKVAVLLAVLFITGLGSIVGWRYGDVPGLWADMGMALSVLSAIAFTLLAVSEAEKVSDTRHEDEAGSGRTDA